MQNEVNIAFLLYDALKFIKADWFITVIIIKIAGY